jgi:branched-subunit amino acid aminotransferase/4-amino-4-deoxychorismate lyase
MADSIPVLSFNAIVDRLHNLKKPYFGHYLAMYSSWYGGIVTEPSLMMVPIDDHLVHRGDGIFEAFKCIDWKVYGLDRHLDRLERSACGAFLPLPLDRPQLVRTILETITAGNSPNCVIRVFVSRGPGGFSINPYESPESQLYVVITELAMPNQEKYDIGVTLKSSKIPMKKAYFANMKNCNYLPNVLMKKEAEDAGVDYTVSLDDQGFLGEGATENVGIINKKREFIVPRFSKVLKGVTITRVMELAAALVAKGDLEGIREGDISPEEAYNAAEVMVFGTSFDVLPVVNYDGRIIGDGKPGPIFKKLLALIREDIRRSPEMLTAVMG